MRAVGRSKNKMEIEQVNDDERAAGLSQDTPLTMHSDPRVPLDGLKFGILNNGLWVHPEVLDAVHEQTNLRKRMSIILQHLGAHGRTSVVKGCSDDANKGWLRTPLGGNNGMQYYLWWAPQGSRPIKTLNLPSGNILVRAVRHHDDHNLLRSGELNDYLSFKQREIEDEELVGRPWTDEQLQFVEADDPVRLILGRPGSGKTTVLWKAVEARSDQRVLYLTWSRELTRYAHEHFVAFAPSDVHVETRDFLSFIGEICCTDIKRLTLRESLDTFLQTISKLQPNVLGPWTGRKSALFAEIRAFLVGRAVPGEEGCDSTYEFVRLNDTTYLNLRGDSTGVGYAAAMCLVKVLESVQGESAFKEIFPELAAAEQAITLLRKDDIPEGFSDFDRIVVDEIQDLTLVEATVVVEFCRAVARRRGYAPWLLAAGDDGQTVRPTGFDWGTLNDLIVRRVRTPQKFQLEDNLRCPARIAGVVERASTLYAHLEKGRRPTKQRHKSGGQYLDAHLFYVDAQSVADAVDLLEQLEEIEGVVVLSPQDDAPSWVPSHLRDAVLTPADAKGLEYQGVVLLDPGKLLARFAAMDAGAAELEEQARRTTIDQLRVALSRATEILAFLDVEATEEERKSSCALLNTFTPYDPEDLIEHFTNINVAPEERVLTRTKNARAQIDERPKLAWQRALQAMRLLGNSELPNGVATPSVRIEAYRTLLAIAARLLVDGTPPGVSRRDVIDAAGEALKELGAREEARAFRQLDDWCSNRYIAPFPLFDATLRLGSVGDWLRAALVGVTQVLRQTIDECANSAASAKEFTGDVDGWLDLTGYVGDKVVEVRRLRCKAVDTLLTAQDLESAEEVLEQIVPSDTLRLAHLRKAQGKYVEAESLYKRSLMIRESELGSDHVDVARSLCDLAHLYHIQGAYTEAEPHVKRALVIRERELGPDHPLVANTLNDLAVLYHSQGSYTESVPLLKRSLAIREKTLGSDHIDVATSLYNLSETYGFLGNHTEALSYTKRALVIREEALGSDHPDVVSCLGTLAGLYSMVGEHEEVEAALKRILTIREETLKPDHPEMANSLYHLAYFYYGQDDYAKSVPLMQRSLVIYEKTLGPDHQKMARFTNFLGVLYTNQGTYTKAELLLKRSLSITEKTLGPNHPDLVAVLDNLVTLYSTLGLYYKIERFLKQKLAITEEILGADHPDVIQNRADLTDLSSPHADFSKAEMLYKRELEICEKELGAHHLDVANVLQRLVGIYLLEGRESEALKLDQRATQILDRKR